MSKKQYQITEIEPMSVEPQSAASSDRWNPNEAFHGTQEEWWDHFHKIEKGNFHSLEEHERDFEAWEKEYLASRLK
ncbi:MAG: hypothetical protein LBD28_07600 [Tannerellaceae bacterium]|nr:hypothetical protein [Tannerellaceae bacterium]